MKRGEIYFADLNPTIGSEVRKTRPVLIVSNNANNKVASTVTIVSITSNTKKIYPFEVLLMAQKFGLPKESKVQCNQIRTISKLRIRGNKVGDVDWEIMLKIHYALKIHLALI